MTVPQGRKLLAEARVQQQVKAGVLAVVLAMGCALGQPRTPPSSESSEPDAGPPVVAETKVADAGVRPCVPMPAGFRPVLVDRDFISVTCGRCGPECQERITKADMPEWRKLLASPLKARVLFAGGEFGEPGKSVIRGPAWELFLVFETPPPPETRDTWRVDIDGARPFVRTSWVNSFGSLEASVMLFGDQLPQGPHTITVTACDGAVLLAQRVELVARHEY